MNYYKSIILLFLTTITIELSAQNDNIFNAIGFGAFTSGLRTPAATSDYSTYDSIYYYDNVTGIGFISLEYNFRYSIWTPTDGFSIGVNASPLLSSYILNGFESGFGASISMPLFVSINFGEGATYSGNGNVGGYVGFGYEYIKVFGAKAIEDSYPATTEQFDPITSWGQLKIATGFRWWSKGGNFYEISFKYGFGKQKNEFPTNKYQLNNDVKNPMSWSLTFAKFLNY